MQWLKNKFDAKDVKSEKEPDNLPKHLKKYFFNKDKSFNSGRYEYWVYKQMQEQIVMRQAKQPTKVNLAPN